MTEQPYRIYNSPENKEADTSFIKFLPKALNWIFYLTSSPDQCIIWVQTLEYSILLNKLIHSHDFFLFDFCVNIYSSFGGFLPYQALILILSATSLEQACCLTCTTNITYDDRQTKKASNQSLFIVNVTKDIMECGN